MIYFIVACAQQRPNREPDRTVSVASLTSARMTIQSEAALQTASEPNFVTASSEQSRGIISSVSGPGVFVPLLEGLRTGLVGTFDVRLGLTPKHVIAYALVSKDNVDSLARVDQILLQSIAQQQERVAQGLMKMDLGQIPSQFNLLPIAQMDVQSAGILRNTQNEIGENTPILEIIPTDFSHVQHFILGHQNTRSRMIFSSEQIAKEVFLESTFHGRVTEYSTLRAQTGIKLRLENSAEKVLTERKGRTINIFRFFKKSTLSSDELVALVAGQSDVIRACSSGQAEAAAIPQEDCVLMLSFTVPVQIVAVERGRDSEGFETGEVGIRVLTPAERSQGLVQIIENVEVAEVRPDQVLSNLDERKILRPKALAGKEFLFRRTLQDSPNSFDYAFAGLSGDLEIIRFEFEEASVKVQRAEALLSTTGNSSVDKEILMEVPAQYFVVTNVGPDGTQLPFERLIPSTVRNPDAIALVDWSANKVPNVSSPLNYFGLENCFSSRTQSVSEVDSRISKDGMLNFTLTSTYASSSVFDCAGIEMADYFDRLQTIFSFKERVSFKEYKRPAQEEPTLNVPLLAQKKMGFGLFTYSKKKPNASGEIHLEDNIVNLPSVFDFRDGRTITYVVAGLPSKEIQDPAIQERRAAIIAATERVVSDLNLALRKATQGTALQRSTDFVNLAVEGDGIDPRTLGDLDRNYIYYVEKATESPIIGLGGSHPNPRSGRVEAASVFLYAGNMSKAIARMKRRYLAEQVRDAMMAPVPLEAEGGNGEERSREAESRGLSPVARSRSSDRRELPSFNVVDGKFAPGFVLTASGKRNVERKGRMLNRLDYVGNRLDRREIEQRLSPKSSKLVRALDSLRSEGHLSSFGLEKEALIAKSINASLGVKSPSKALVGRVRRAHYCVLEAKSGPNFSPGEGKNLLELSDTEALARMWTATLAHELGHNFGLRHNFMGSFDVTNWSSGEETIRDYSSIMDYLNNDFDSYDGFGPQDVAALRAGYGEVVDRVDGSSIAINQIPELLGRKGWLDISKAEIQSLGVKDYAFCTDEDVGLTPTCQRFDEGTTPLEIVENKIRDYRNRYSLLHFPNDRLNFDLGAVGEILGRNISDFIEMRQFLEESIYQLIQGADVQTVVIPHLQAAMRAMSFFQEIIRTPDASSYMESDALPRDPQSLADRFLEFEVNTKQGPMLLRGESKWLEDTTLDGELNRLKVVGVELDKVISLILLTERNFGFPRYEAISLRLAYPDIEKLVIDVPSPEQLPTHALLREILDDRIETEVDTALGTLELPPAYRARTTEMMRFYAALGAIANLDVNGLEAADNNSTLFRVFSDLQDVPAGVPVMSRLGSQSDLKFWANPENRATALVVDRGATLQNVIQGGVSFKNLMAQLVAAKYPELAAEGIPELSLDDLRAQVTSELEKFPEEAVAPSLEELEAEVDDLLATSSIVETILGSGAGRDFLIQLEQFKNNQLRRQIENPVLGLGIEALFDSNVLATPAGLDFIAESRSLEPHYGNIFQNMEITSQIFSVLHPEYFR